MNIYSVRVLPYVYQVTHKTTGQFYIGVRWANKVPSTEDLGKHYFTSSKNVKNDFINYTSFIIAEFFNKEDAFNYEQQLIQENKYNKLMLNQMLILNGKPGFCGMSGRHHTEETKWIMSMIARGQRNEVEKYKAQKLKDYHKKRSDEMKEKNPGFIQGNIPWNLNKPWSTVEKEKRSLSMLGVNVGRKQSDELKARRKDIALNRTKKRCKYCHHDFDPANFARYHGDKCKFK